MRQQHSFPLARASAVAGVLALSGCVAADVEPVTVNGECKEVHGAQVCTWAKVNGDSLVEVGANIPVAAIENAPPNVEMTWPPVALAELNLPPQAQARGVNHLTIYWEAHGHPPGAYMTPHFDFHFYSIDQAQRKAIDCKNTAKPAALAASYDLPDVDIPGLGMLKGLCVPLMGMHSAPAAELASTQVFDGTMIIGYYNQKPIFFEPMIARAHLLKKQSFTLDMPAVPGAEGYPNSFKADYDAASQTYRFVFTGF